MNKKHSLFSFCCFFLCFLLVIFLASLVVRMACFRWNFLSYSCFILNFVDTIRPVVSCPSSKTLRLQHANDNITVTFGATDFLDFSSSDAGGIATSTFSPAAYTFTTANLYTAVPITLTVVDNNNNAASCSFSVRTMRKYNKSCIPERIGQPHYHANFGVHGNTLCYK